mmetsp:Transcript_31363/g.82220  ORF Transcript_31363/g.82220 Transcript_31363/m.82220 type:complete len:204 (+) Transcript_31363:2411-3022(+)
MCRYDRPKHTTRLLRGGANPSIADKEGRTPLHYAVADERTACLKALLKSSKTNVSRRDGAGRTPLHLAANNEGVSCLAVLVKVPGVEVNAADEKGTTALHWAAVSNNVEACCVLVQYGADLAAVDGEGKTAEDHAAAQGFDACVEALKDLKKNPMAHIEYVVSSPKHPVNRRNSWQAMVAKVKAQETVKRELTNRRSSACIIC